MGGVADTILMRIADIQLAFPSILLALAIVGFLGSGLWYVIIVLGFTGWVSYARVVRSEVLSLRSREFVTEARAIGVGNVTIMRRHLLPNVMAPLATIAARMEALFERCDLDGMMLIFPDYPIGLRRLGSEILPRLGR